MWIPRDFADNLLTALKDNSSSVDDLMLAIKGQNEALNGQSEVLGALVEQQKKLVKVASDNLESIQNSLVQYAEQSQNMQAAAEALVAMREHLEGVVAKLALLSKIKGGH